MWHSVDSNLSVWTPVQVLSLEELSARFGFDSGSIHSSLRDSQPRPDEALERQEALRAVGDFVSSLTAREQEIVRRVFWGEETQTAVAAALGVSKMAVCKTLARIFERGRNALAVHEHSAIMN